MTKNSLVLKLLHCVMLLLVTLLCYITCATATESTSNHSTANLTGCFLTADNASYAAGAVAPLLGHNFSTDYQGKQVKICLCCSISESDTNVSAIVTTSGPATRIYGRRNCSRMTGSGHWTMLDYWGGDVYEKNSTCQHLAARGVNATRHMEVIITCNSALSKASLTVIFMDECDLLLELQSAQVCNTTGGGGHSSGGLSHGSVFCILFGVGVGAYLLVGVCYRRLLLGAKGIDQLPNKDFWLNLGHLQADGCNFVCRRGDAISVQRADAWQRISGGNFTDSDRDDAPLQP